jgi:hypothetical protein
VPDSSNPQSLNRFAYVRNNPLKSIDPSGHKECEKASKLGTCESATNAERDYSQICAEMPSFCIPDTSPEHLLEVGLFAITAFTGIGLASAVETVVAGLYGVAGYGVGNTVGNALQGKPLGEGLNVKDAFHSFVSGGISSGISNPFIVGGVVGGQYAVGQILDGEEVNPLSLVTRSVMGSASASLAGGLSAGAEKTFSASIVNPVIQQGANGLVTNILAPVSSDNIVSTFPSLAPPEITRIMEFILILGALP